MSRRLAIAALALAACTNTSLHPPPDMSLNSPPDASLRPPADASLNPPPVHRPTAAACPMTRPPTASCSRMNGMGCHMDSECAMGTNGRCLDPKHNAPGCWCSYDQCRSDADCKTTELCDCREATASNANVCLPSNCRTDKDCAKGGTPGYCSPSLDPTCGTYAGVTGWWCRTADDTCSVDEDCKTDGGVVAGFCAYHPESSRWACSYGGCAG